MRWIQETIHKLEVESGNRILRLLVMILAVAVLGAVYNMRGFKNFENREAMDLSQLARNLASGRGYQTDYIRPLSIQLLQKHTEGEYAGLDGAHPELTAPPAYPFLLSLWMRALPFEYRIEEAGNFSIHQPEMLIAFFNQLWFVAALILLWKTANKLFDEGVAGISVGVMAGSELIWKFTTSGLTTLMAMTLLLGVIFVVLKILERSQDEETPPSGKWCLGMSLAAGLLIGIGTLTRYSFFFAAFPAGIMLFIAFPRRRFLLTLAMFVVAAAAVAPWLYRNYQICGQPLGLAGYHLLQGTGVFTDDILIRSLSPEYDLIAYRDFYRKFMTHLADILVHGIPWLAGSWIIALFLPTLLIPFQSRIIVKMRAFIVLLLAVFCLVEALSRSSLSEEVSVVNSENQLALLAPLIIIFGVGMFHILLDQIHLPFPEARFWVQAAFLLIMSLPLILKVLPPRESPLHYPPYYPPVIQKRALWLEPNEIMMSDIPWAVAWYGGRSCVFLTLTIEDFYSINDYMRPLSAIYLTPRTMNASLASDIATQEKSWGRLAAEIVLNNNPPRGFPLLSAPDAYLPHQLFLTDRKRWISGN